MFTTSESPNIRFQFSKSLFLFIEGGQENIFHWSKKYFGPLQNQLSLKRSWHILIKFALHEKWYFLLNQWKIHRWQNILFQIKENILFAPKMMKLILHSNAMATVCSFSEFPALLSVLLWCVQQPQDSNKSQEKLWYTVREKTNLTKYSKGYILNVNTSWGQVFL